MSICAYIFTPFIRAKKKEERKQDVSAYKKTHRFDALARHFIASNSTIWGNEYLVIIVYCYVDPLLFSFTT